MNFSEPNTAQDESPKVLTTESVDWANETHKEFSDRIVKLAIEGLNRLAAEKAAEKNSRQAA
jgi:uncharacterized small protein (DUF1192 family)